MLLLDLLDLLKGETPEVHAQEVIVVRLIRLARLSTAAGALPVFIHMHLGLLASSLAAASALEDGIELAHRLEVFFLQLLQQVGLLLLPQLELPLHHHEDEAGLVAKDLLLARGLGDEVGLPPVIDLPPQLDEVLEDVQARVVLGDLTFRIEQHHVGGRDRRAQLECLLKALFLGPFHLLCRHGHLEVDTVLGVVFFVVGDGGVRGALFRFLALCRHEFLEELLVALSPLADGQL
mmetsp:Transcript_56004/g.120527  ORF Transcript_56004/g.120527 Transcript_56004/m.120527 type:complete len:235 (+) Transcript_56004:1023-1727(+)